VVGVGVGVLASATVGEAKAAATVARAVLLAAVVAAAMVLAVMGGECTGRGCC